MRWWNAPQERHAIAFPFLNPEHSCSSDRALSGSLERVGDGTAGTGRSNRVGQGSLTSADSLSTLAGLVRPRSHRRRPTYRLALYPSGPSPGELAGLLPAGLAADTDS